MREVYREMTPYIIYYVSDSYNEDSTVGVILILLMKVASANNYVKWSSPIVDSGADS